MADGSAALPAPTVAEGGGRVAASAIAEGGGILSTHAMAEGGGVLGGDLPTPAMAEGAGSLAAHEKSTLARSTGLPELSPLERIAADGLLQVSEGTHVYFWPMLIVGHPCPSGVHAMAAEQPARRDSIRMRKMLLLG